MDDRLDAVQRHCIARDIGLDEPEAGTLAQAREVALFDFARVKRIEVVHAGHRSPSRHKRFAQMRADESGRAGHEIGMGHAQRAPALVTTPRKYSIVRRNPSSRLIAGSQPSFERAAEISGCRTCGSSTGSGRSTILLLLPVNASTRSASW